MASEQNHSTSASAGEIMDMDPPPLSPQTSASSYRPRRGSVQLIHDFNIQQSHHPGNSFPSSSPHANVLAASPLSLLANMLNNSENQQSQREAATNEENITNPMNSADGAPPLQPAVADGTMLEANTFSKRRAARELLPMSNMRHTRSIVDPRVGNIMDDGEQFSDEEDNVYQTLTTLQMAAAQLAVQDEEEQNFYSSQYGSVDEFPPLIPRTNRSFVNDPSSTSLLRKQSEGSATLFAQQQQQQQPFSYKAPSSRPTSGSFFWLEFVIQQVSAVAIVALLNMMMAIPFGASYFPIGWKVEDGSSDGGGNTKQEQDKDDFDVEGQFPLPNKQALGLRMFLFATLVAQLVFAFKSKFINAVGLQMVENVPFLHALAKTVIARQGYGADALSTLFFLFGLSSVIVGLVFYSLGKLQLGRIVYYFPNHVLVGCIGGIGVFLLFTSLEVSTNSSFSLDAKGITGLIQNFNLLWVVLAFDVSLRTLQWLTSDHDGRPKYQLLSPIFYILITPTFYMGLVISGISIDEATDMGYFFPATDINQVSDGGIFSDQRMWDIFKVVNFRTISWQAVLESTGTMIALAAFSLIHVPINIPAFAISTDVETDMNAELVAHGYSNFLSGAFGGLQNYMTYSNSVLYAKTGGRGLFSSLAIVLFTAGLFVVGPSICDYLPRCMAGTLLFHIGIDLILEGVYDSIGQYDHLEYFGIWLITIVMTVWGMTAALIAGIISALSTYAVQSINYQNPVRQILTATSLRSSAWTRCASARSILENEKIGRARILIFQLQGHLFFGNVAQMTDTIKDVLKEKSREGDLPIVVIIDFTLVVGMDSSAAHAIAKLKKIIHRFFGVEVSVFVTGSDRGGFPCEFALSAALEGDHSGKRNVKGENFTRNAEASSLDGKPFIEGSRILSSRMDGRVCESLDEALKFAEDILIARRDPHHHFTSSSSCFSEEGAYGAAINLTVDEELYRAKRYLRDLLEDPDDDSRSAKAFLLRSIDMIIGMMTREEYKQENIIWEQGAESTCMKIVVSGELVSVIDETGASETVARGNVVGELGLVQPGTKRLTTLVCATPKAVLYSLDRMAWDRLRRDHPKVATLVDGLVIRYLAHRVQHVSNRYFHTTLPV